jgi:hypothetical protein
MANIANIIEIKFNIVHNQSAWECLGQIEDSIGILSNDLKTQVLDIMGYGEGFTPGLHALRNGDVLLIQYNNYSESLQTHTIEINLTDNIAIYRELLDGAIYQFPYGDYFKLESKNLVQILDHEFNIVQTFNRVNVLDNGQRYKIFYHIGKTGIFDSITGKSNYLMAKIIWGTVIDYGERKGDQIFLLQSNSSKNHYFIADHNGNPFESGKKIASFVHNGSHDLASIRIVASSKLGSIMVGLSSVDFLEDYSSTKLFMVINTHGIFTISTELIFHSNEDEFCAYHPKVIDSNGFYQKVCLSPSLLDDIDRDYIGYESYSLFGNIQTPEILNVA